MRIVLAKKIETMHVVHTHTHTHTCENALKCVKYENASEWSLVPPKEGDRQIFAFVSPRGLTYKFSLNAANPRQ